MAKTFLFVLMIIPAIQCLADAISCDKLLTKIDKRQRVSVLRNILLFHKKKDPEVSFVNPYVNFQISVAQWHIVHFGSHSSDDGNYFFRGDPTKVEPIENWGGGSDSEENYESLIKKNIKGIPVELAKCFEWFEINEGDMQVPRYKESIRNLTELTERAARKCKKKSGIEPKNYSAEFKYNIEKEQFSLGHFEFDNSNDPRNIETKKCLQSEAKKMTVKLNVEPIMNDYFSKVLYRHTTIGVDKSFDSVEKPLFFFKN